MELIHSIGGSTEIVSPSSWQNTCRIFKRDRAGRKAGAVEFVKKYYNIENVEQDAVDAICIGHHFLEKEGAISAF